MKLKKGLKVFQGLQYWIGAISYLIILSLSMLCLVSYLPHLSETDALDRGTLNILNAMLIIVLVVGTAAFIWETRNWLKRRVPKSETSVEDIIKNVNKGSNNSN